MRAAMVEDPQVRAKAEDFVNRYTTGNPYEDYDEREAAEMFEMVRAEASPEELREALQETIRNFTPEQKRAFEAAVSQQGGDAAGAMGISASGGHGEAAQRQGVGGNLGDVMAGSGQLRPTGGQRSSAGAGGSGLDDMLGGLFGGTAGGGQQAPSSSPFGGLLGGLLGSAGQPLPQQHRPQAGNDPIGGLLGGLLGGGLVQPPQGYAGQQSQTGGGIGDILGGLFGGGQQQPMPRQDPFSQMFGGQQMQQPNVAPDSGMNSALMKMVLGGVAAFAMKRILSGGR